MKITFVIGAMVRGGAERVVSILSKHYAELGHSVEICMLLHNRIEYQLDERIKVLDFSGEEAGKNKDFVSLYTKTRKHFKQSRPDVIVSFMAPIAMLVDGALTGMKIRHIVSERIDPSMVNRGKIYEAILHRAYSRAERVVLQTKRAYNYFPEKVQKKSVIILNPIDVKVKAADIKDDRIVTVGRLEKQKNHKMLINAFAPIRDKHPSFKVDIYGEGTMCAELERHIKKCKLEKSVFLKGGSSKIHEDIASAKLFVLSSDYEGLSNALLEAMMMGIPVISTACSGSDEIIIDGENGMLIPVGDEKALVLAMDKILSDPMLRKKIGEGAKASAEQFKTENVIKKWDEVILG